MDWDLWYLPAKKRIRIESEHKINLLGLMKNNNYNEYYFPLLTRPERIFKFSFIYYSIMITNLFMRFTWAVTISVSGLKALSIPPAWSRFLALVEIFRRAQWIVFRTENEMFQVMRHKEELVRKEKEKVGIGIDDGDGESRDVHYIQTEASTLIVNDENVPRTVSSSVLQGLDCNIRD